MKRYYAGIGSRKAPLQIIQQMIEISIMLESKGYTIRSGGAAGSDLAFQQKTTNREIYLPWNGFNKFYSSMSGFYNVSTFDNYKLAEKIASRFHPTWNRLSNTAKMFMTRNTYQVLGLDLKTPSEYVICWTPDGATFSTTNETGGTGQAIRLAHDLNIPIYNLKNPNTFKEIMSWNL